VTQIVVSGAPGTGKSTVAAALGAALRFPVLSLDPIKEALADVLGLGGEDWSNQVGDAAAEVLWFGRQGFALDVKRPGKFLVRVSFTPYWSIARGQGCLFRHGEWTLARASRPGVFRVTADFSLGRAWNAVTGAKKTC